jgi:SAM-dependent methyltransferase
MKKLIKKLLRVILIPFVLKDYFAFKRKADSRFTLSIKDFYPQIKDKTIKTGFDRHYVYHTGWAARKVKEINPAFHIDISSSLYFTSIVSAFIPVHFYDYRPAELYMNGIESKEGDLHHLPFDDNSVASISCMHTIEHIGLGRYTDPIDPQGDLKAMKELIRVVKPGGSLIFVTPIGKNALIEFNAHRIYTLPLIKDYFKELELVEFSLIPEHAKDGGILLNAGQEDVDKERYGCGCFWFKKI